MLSEPRLITPQGQTIVLTTEQYQKVAEALALPTTAEPVVEKPRLTPEELRALADQLQGMFADGPSLTAALLEERRKDREREEARIRRFASHA